MSLDGKAATGPGIGSEAEAGTAADGGVIAWASVAPGALSGIRIGGEVEDKANAQGDQD